MFSIFRRKPAPIARVIPWGGVEFEEHELAPHYAVMGMTNSGKTLTIRMLMKAVLAPSSPERQVRALVYDPKRDFYPVLVGMGVPEESIVVFHPFDSRSTAWDIAADVNDAASSRQIAEILSPREKQNVQPFFINASIDLVTSVIDVFRTLRPGAWTLNDVIEAFTTHERLRKVLNLTPDGRDVLQIYLGGSQETGSNVFTTIRTKLVPYATAARLSARAKTKLSLTEWATSLKPRVLLLGTDDTNGASLDPLNRAIFLRASQLVTGRVDENPADESWFFVDEARWAGKLEGLTGLMLKGRSKGAHVVLGFQDILGLRDVYEGMVADEIVGQCGNFAVLKLNSPVTMNWASSYFGQFEEYVASFGESSSAQGNSSSVNYSLTVRHAMLEQEFRNFPLPDPDSGITGAFSCPDKAWRDTVPKRFVSTYLRSPSSHPGFDARPPQDQDRVPWPDNFLPWLKDSTPSPSDAGNGSLAPNAGRPLITMKSHKQH